GRSRLRDRRLIRRDRPSTRPAGARGSAPSTVPPTSPRAARPSAGASTRARPCRVCGDGRLPASVPDVVDVDLAGARGLRHGRGEAPRVALGEGPRERLGEALHAFPVERMLLALVQVPASGVWGAVVAGPHEARRPCTMRPGVGAARRLTSCLSLLTGAPLLWL